MVYGDSPEVLPEGWTVQFSALKTGRKVKCYANSGTGQKFFSKADLMRHIKSRHTQLDWPQPAKSPNGSPSQNNQMALIEYTNGSPEWLPHGWIVELKIKKSGASCGKQYKCYVEPSTGCKFYSKPEVFRYLETLGQRSSTSKQKETFMSVLPTSKVSLRDPDAKVKSEKSTVEDLPTGWIKEIKIQRKANGIRKDPYYIDPVSGYAFRSKRDVQRYLETGKISACKILPKKRDINDDEISPSSAAKSQKIEHLATGQQLFMGQGNFNGNSVVSSGADSLREREGKTASTLTSFPVATATEVPSGTISSDNSAESKKKCNANWTAPTNAEVSKLNEVKNAHGNGGHGLLIPQADKQEQNHESGVKKGEIDKTRNSLSKSHFKKGLNMPRRSSKRLAGIEPEMVANSLSIVQAISEADSKEEQNPININFPYWSIEQPTMIEPEPVPNTLFIVQTISEADNKQEQNSTESGMKVDRSHERSQNGNIDDKNLHHRSTEQLTMVEPEPMANTMSIVQAISESDDKQEQNSPESGMKGDRSHGRSENSLSNSINKNLHHWSAKPFSMIELQPEANTLSVVQALPKTIRSSKGEVILAVGVTKDGLADKTTVGIKNEPKLELLVHTSTGSSPLLGEPSIKSQKSVTTCPVEPKAKVFEGSQYGVVNSNDGSVPTPEVDTMKEQKSLKSWLKGSNHGSTQNSLSTKRNKKASNLPRRSSKRLAGLEPELAVNSESRAQNAEGSCRSESREAVGPTPDGLVHIASQQIKGEPRIELPHYPFVSSLQEPLNKNQVLLHGQAFSKYQSQMLEANKMNDEKSESKLVPPFGEFLSDPCLEFAFKTLTGEIPVEITANNGMVSTPASDILDGRNLLMEKIDKGSNGKTPIKSRKCKNSKKLPLPHQTPEFEHNSMASAYSSDRAFESKTKRSRKVETVRNKGLASKKLAVGASRQPKNLKTMPQNEPSNYRIEHQNNCTASEVEKNSNKPELPAFFSYGDYWSDPCFEFAFKTLTGAIPMEDNLPFQSYFQQQVDTSPTQREACFQQVVDASQTPRDGSMALPDFGLPSFFQTDISVHFDASDKQLVTQPQGPSSNPSFVPSGSVSLPSCSSLSSQQPAQLKENKGLRGKVYS